MRPISILQCCTLLVLTIMTFWSSGCIRSTPPVEMSPDHEEFSHFARYLFTKNEREIFVSLTDSADREEFIRHFWEIRDPNPFTEENEFKIEMERRLEYVNHYLKEGPLPGWKTDRGRIYILLGEPDQKYEDMYPYDYEYKTVIIWFYEIPGTQITFVDERGNGIYRMLPMATSLNFLDILENRKYYIMNKDSGGGDIQILKFDAKYDQDKKELHIAVEPKNLTYEDDPEHEGMKLAKVKVAIVAYDQHYHSQKFSHVDTIRLDSEALLKKQDKIPIIIPITLKPGKASLDIMINDFLGNALQREFIKFTVTE